MSQPIALHRLSVDDVVRLNTQMRDAARDSGSMAEAAQRISSLLHALLLTDAGTSASALVRLYVTSRLSALPPELRAVANASSSEARPADTPCLTLLGTAGLEASWCDRRLSEQHRAIPLDSEDIALAAPMVAELMAQLGVELAELAVLDNRSALVRHHRDYGVFRVADPAASPVIPAKEFVRDYDVRCVVGCGGAFPSGEVFALIVFARTAVDDGPADLFRTLAYGIKAALVPFTFTVFDDSHD